MAAAAHSTQHTAVAIALAAMAVNTHRLPTISLLLPVVVARWVLRPPGGGTSDIFGGDLPQTPRNVKNHMQSNIFSCDKNGAIKNNGDQPRRGQQKVDSYQRLFGEPERPGTPAKNHMKSNIPFGSNTEAAQELLANGNGHHSNGKGGSVSTSTSSSVSSSTENLKMNGVSKTGE
ncbi:microtubule-associated protein Jupiter-like [Anastrepha ludens]|uniref:microtubule-associated protein Jupiter-like n=1 Tax=Anastrepha ludens TaxID=28586 RepID=UPI0023AF6739|nr:microtubule-associated protein Jupiter-like [Anastrepha ludens]